MNLKIFIILITQLFIINLSSQTIKGRIVRDDNPNSGLESVKIIVTKENDTKPVGMATTDEKGFFSIDFRPELNIRYHLTARYIGFENISELIPNTELPKILNIKMKSTTTQLQEVEVEGTRARAVIKEDTVIYDAKAFKTHKDASVEDLVTKMPGITKENGEVKAYGETVNKVLVDGQEFFGDDANIALKNLPAETIDKVEVFDAFNDRDAFTGNTSGNTTKTMNLKTKPGMNKGMFGKAYAGYGTNNRYQAGGNYNYYNGTQRVSFLGMANNINNLNFSTSEIVGAMTGSSNMGARGNQMMRGMSFGMNVSSTNRNSGFRGPLSNFSVSNKDGVNDVYSFGVNYNDKWGKKKATTVNLSYFGNKTDNYTNTLVSQSNILSSQNTLKTKQDYTSNSENYNHKFTSRFDGRLDTRNSYIWTNKLSLGDNKSSEISNLTNNFENSINGLKNINQTSSNSNTVDFNTNFLYKLGFKRAGRTFSINTILDISSQKGTSNQNFISEYGTLSNSYGLNYWTNQWNSTITNVLTYTEPSGKFGQWLINYSPSFSNRINDREVSTYNNTQTLPVLNDSLSNKFTNNLFYNVGGISYRLQFSKWRFMFGSSIQNINFEGKERYPSNSYLNKDFFGVLPYFNIQFKTMPMTRLKLTYNTTMNVPSITQIQPILDLSNPVSIYKGNENLLNDYNHNLFFHFMKPNITKGTFLIFVSNISYTLNNISNYSYTGISDTIIDNISIRRGVTYNKYVNIDGAFSGFLFGNYTQPIKKLKSNFSMNGNYTHSRTPSMVNLKENITSMNMYSVGLMLSSNISENIDFSLSYNPKYLTNSFSLSNIADNNYWIHSISNNLKLTFMKNFVWSYDFAYNYNSQIDPSINQHIFLLGSSLAYKFLKNNQLEAKLTVFDIFNQNRNISRSINNNIITDSKINAMNRYGLFTLTYNFKKFQGKDPDKSGDGFMRMMHRGGNH